MNLSHPRLKQAIRLALTLPVLSTSVAFAAEGDEDSGTERIEVTGSRIKRTDLETTSPVLSISREDIDRSGQTSLGDVLKDIATNGASLGLQTNNGNTGGVTRVNLRNCASTQNLLLVNGRRWVTNLGGNVDLTTIPLEAVTRIEVLKDGASSVYGTDAICGVINVITRSDFDGAEFRSHFGETDEGDGRREIYSFTVGSSGDKTSGLVNVSYTQQAEIMGGDREISSVPIYGLPSTISSSGGRASPTTPYGQFRVGATSMTLDPNNEGCLPNVPCDPATADQFRAYNPLTDGYNFAPVNYIQQPQETLSLFSQGRLDFTDDITGKLEVVYHERTSEAQLAAQPLGGMAIAANNMYNPFGVAITGASFRPIVAPRSFGAEVDTWRFGAGIEGSFELAGRVFDWDVGTIYSDQDTVQLKTGFFNADRMALATGRSELVNGTPTCLTATGATIAGCVPFNLFGGPDGVTADMLNYVTVAPRNLNHSEMRAYHGTITGDIFELPAGQVAFAAGVEKRFESGYTNPDPLTQSGRVLGDNPVLPTSGGYSVEEAYVEFALPILNDLPGAQSLDLEVSTRTSRYDTYGSTDNSRFAIAYRPITDLLVRLSWAEGFRAPSIAELFAGQATGRPAVADPCDSSSDTYQDSATVQANCAAAGVPTNFTQANPQAFSTSGGNPDLEPEEAESKSIGFVYSPSFLEGFSATLDWYNIEIEHTIGARTAQSILDGCYEQSNAAFCTLITRDFTGNIGNVGEISGIQATNLNFQGGTEIEGVDLNLDYRFQSDIGTWRVTWDTAYVIYLGDLGQLHEGEVNADGDISSGNLAGTLTAGLSGGGTNHRLKSNITLAWSLDNWSAALQFQFMSKQVEDCSNVTNAAAALGRPELRNLCSDPDHRGVSFEFAPDGSVVSSVEDQPENELEAIVYVDAKVDYSLPWNAQVGVGVRNLTDEDPPYAFSAFANTYDPQYRTPGQYFYLTYNQTF